MASASGKALRDLRNLKTEESALLEVINDLKNQLNRLKVRHVRLPLQ